MAKPLQCAPPFPKFSDVLELARYLSEFSADYKAQFLETMNDVAFFGLADGRDREDYPVDILFTLLIFQEGTFGMPHALSFELGLHLRQRVNGEVFVAPDLGSLLLRKAKLELLLP